MKHLANSCPYRKISLLRATFFSKYRRMLTSPVLFFVSPKVVFDTINRILLKLAGQIH